MIEFRELRKSYGEVEALRGVSASIPGGQIVGLLGPNGAGKTTTMKILVGYLLPTSGAAQVAGHDVVADPRAVQRAIGYLPENAPLYGEMTPRDYFGFVAAMRGLQPRATRMRIGAVAAECGVTEVLDRPIAQLSKGYRQRVGLAAAILHDPPILILDEPTTGLDPNQIVEVRDLIRRMGERKTVILSTHILPEVEATCDRAILIYRGRIRADGTLDELTRSRTQVVELRADDPAGAEAALAALPGVTGSAREPAADGFVVIRLALDGDRDVGPAAFELAAARGWTLRALRRDDRTLEHVFRELTGEAGVPA